jgi:hypothetical protein
MIRGFVPCVKWRPVVEHAMRGSITPRGIAASSAPWARKMPDRPPPVSEAEFTEAFLKGSGPGGQKIVCSILIEPIIKPEICVRSID